MGRPDERLLAKIRALNDVIERQQAQIQSLESVKAALLANNASLRVTIAQMQAKRVGEALDERRPIYVNST